jgi:Ca-activated chloride channel family protein
MIFDSFPLLVLAPALGVLLGVLAWLARRARLRATAVWAPSLAAPWLRKGRMVPLLVGGAGLLAGIGAAGPRWGRTVTEMQGRALNLAIAMDISRSMLAEDVSPNRLQRATREAERLVQDARGDRLALLAFAGRSYILTPLTLDDAAVALQLDALDPEIASEGGTELADVLQQGKELLTAAAEGGAKVLVVFTDGETHDSLPATIAAARALRSAGITLALVGEGDTLPVRIPLRDDSGKLLGYKTDSDGREVRTWRRDDVLREVTDAAGGVLVAGTLADQAGAVRQVIAGLERSATRERRREDLTPRGWLFGLGAITLLGLQGLLRRGPAVALLALSLLPQGKAQAQRPSAGDRLLHRGDTSGAALAFAREAPRRLAADTALFNAGTAALARGEVAAARQWLEAAARSLDPELRFRALYNLGLNALLNAPHDSAHRTELRDEAATRFREALLLRPDSRETKWNLELAQNPLPPPSGGGGGAGKPPPAPPRNAPPTPSPSGNALSRAEAEQILNSVERTERDVRADQAHRLKPAHSAAGKDW